MSMKLESELFSKFKRMDIKEFRKFGYLQEVNRRFFHPLGLALSVGTDSGGNESLGSILDSREDPEGIIFTPDKSELVEYTEKSLNVQREYKQRSKTRKEALGFVIQTKEHMASISEGCESSKEKE